MKRRLCYLLLFLFSASCVLGQAKLVGLTRGNVGRIIEYTTGASAVTTPKIFSDEKALPWYNDLIQAKNGKLYGMTESGGAWDKGILFSYIPEVESSYEKLYDFGNPGAAVKQPASPFGSLVQHSNGLLYGLTESGGDFNKGTLFSFNIETKALQVLHHFNGANGRSPYGSLVEATNGKLYGVTESGGSSDYGTIFSYAPGSEGFKLLHEFKTISGTNPSLDQPYGRSPYGSLVQVGTELYGVAQFGGTYNVTRSTNIQSYGVLFSISLTGNFQRRADFRWANGAWPNSTLVNVDGLLYGTAESGGTHNYGVIYSFNPSNNQIAKAADFNETNGRSPYGKLAKVSDGTLYGMTFRGGTADKGVLYQFNPGSSSILKKVDFTGANGMNPAASLIEIKIIDPIALPLTLLSFTANENGNGVQLVWDVESEFDIQTYEVERSTDGTRYNPIGSVAAINSQSKHQYQFTDLQPAGGNNFYRLKIIEKNRAPHYSPIRVINKGKQLFKVSVQPNPVTSNANLYLSLLTKSKVHVQLYNAQGMVVMQWPATLLDKGEHHIPLQINALPNGTYLLRVEAGKAKQTLQLIKVNGR